MDELDQLVTPKQDVIYNFFNWPSIARSKLIVIAVANTHDLPERVMSGKVRSRLGEPYYLLYYLACLYVSMSYAGMVRINFNPYNSVQLQKIVHARLDNANDGSNSPIFEQDAVKFGAMKISGVSGDARRILDVCRHVASVLHVSSRPYHTTKTSSGTHPLYQRTSSSNRAREPSH